MNPSKLMSLAVLSIALLALAVPANAGTACFNLSPFCDVLQLDFSVGPTGFVDVAGGWWACPPRPGDTYNMPVAGAIYQTVAGSGLFRVGLHGTHSTVFFGGQHDCIIDGTIAAPGFTGPALIDCENVFQVPVDLVPIPCPAPLQKLPGKPAGAGQ